MKCVDCMYDRDDSTPKFGGISSPSNQIDGWSFFCRPACRQIHHSSESLGVRAYLSVTAVTCAE